MSNCIYSIDGDDIDKCTPFVIIDMKLQDLIKSGVLYKKYEDDECVILGVEQHYINDLLLEKNIILHFVPIADIIVMKNNTPTYQKILLVNESSLFAKEPVKYEKIMKIGNGFIWKPNNITFPSVFKCLGLIFSTDEPEGKYKLIDNKIITNSQTNNPELSCSILRSNEYGMFVVNYDERLTIDPLRIIFEGHQCYINNDKVIETFDNTSNMNMEMKQFNDNNITCLPDGRVQMNNKCLDVENGKVTENDCVYTDPEKWIFHNGQIINNDTGLCLKSDGKKASLINCEAQSKEWNKSFGKNVVLVESDNPWYVRTNSTTPMDYSVPQPLDVDTKIVNNKPIEIPYKTGDDRKCRYQTANCMNLDKIEQFSDMTSSEIKYLLCVLFVLILVFCVFHIILRI